MTPPVRRLEPRRGRLPRPRRRRRGEDRPAAARDEDGALRVPRPPALRAQGEGAVRRVRGDLQQRGPGRAKQQNQAEAALTNGAQVLVLDPVDSASAAAIVARAKQSKIPVISYDRLITGADVDYYISFDNEKVGKLQGQALVDKLKADGKTERHDGDDQRRAHRQQRASSSRPGAHTRHRRQRLKIGAEYDTPGLEPGQGPAGDGAGHHRASARTRSSACTRPMTARPAAPSRR